MGCHFETRKPIWDRTAGRGERARRNNSPGKRMCTRSQRKRGLIVLEFGGYQIGLFPQMNYLSGEHTLKETL